MVTLTYNNQTIKAESKIVIIQYLILKYDIKKLEYNQEENGVMINDILYNYN